MKSFRIKLLNQEIISCEACPRLRKYCLRVAIEKKKAHLGEVYWGKPIPGFGDPQAKIHIMGLAPAAHGANRTGRIFTGDRSGVWLYRALYRAGLANQPESLGLNDGLKLRNAYVSCVVRCAPPDNQPLPVEIKRCGPFIDRELDLLNSTTRVWIALGGIALHGIWPHLEKRYGKMKRPKFGHGVEQKLPDGRWLILSYHPSQQNTFTGRLTEPMFDSIFNRANELKASS